MNKIFSYLYGIYKHYLGRAKNFAQKILCCFKPSHKSICETGFQKTNARWYYPTHPNHSWFESFARDLSSPDVRIWADYSESVPEFYGWESRHLNDVTTPQDFVDRSAALKAVFDGAMFLYLGKTYEPIKFGVAKAHEVADQPFIRHLPESVDVRVEPFSQIEINKRVTSNEYPFSHQVSTMLFAARYDHVVCDILKYIGVQNLTYVTLYALYDWMTMTGEGWTKKELASKAGWSTAQLKDFTQTANNPAYLGPFCRHGGVDTPPKRPMPLDEAIDPILKATIVFIEERIQSIDLQAKWDTLIVT